MSSRKRTFSAYEETSKSPSNHGDSSGDKQDAIAKAKARLLSRQQSSQESAKMVSRYDSPGTLDERIAAAKRKLTQRSGSQSSKSQLNDAAREEGKSQLNDAEEEGKGGLGVEIHPLLRNIGHTPSLPKNHNPLKQKTRQWFDPTAINPYLNQEDMATTPKQQHKPRPLHFNPQGKYIAKANEVRQRLEQEQIERDKLAEISQKGLIPDENAGEHFYKPQYPPIVEWWDKPYLKELNYDSELRLDSEEALVSLYIQHPVLVPPPWERNSSDIKPMYLTKKELKRIRRNERQQRHKDKQDRIRLGLDAPPPPKVKLSNLMNVLTNEAIRDPTGVEMKVKQEVEERYQKHMQANKDRKLSKEEKHEKIKQQHEKDIQRGLFTTVYKVKSLQNPQHFFKVDMNAKQLDFVGVIVLNPRFNLVIVEGGSKNINFYKKLLTKRIKWTENAAPKVDDSETQSREPSPSEMPDLRDNRCEIMWEGELKSAHFKKWSVMHTSNDDEAYDILQRFGCENYWREAVAVRE